jgi:hypothetical protein
MGCAISDALSFASPAIFAAIISANLRANEFCLISFPESLQQMRTPLA